MPAKSEFTPSQQRKIAKALSKDRLREHLTKIGHKTSKSLSKDDLMGMFLQRCEVTQNMKNEVSKSKIFKSIKMTPINTVVNIQFKDNENNTGRGTIITMVDNSIHVVVEDTTSFSLDDWLVGETLLFQPLNKSWIDVNGFELYK